MANKYYIVAADPGYRDSEKVISGLSYKAALGIFAALQRNYRRWPDMEPAYGEICREGRKGEAGEIIYGHYFEDPLDMMRIRK